MPVTKARGISSPHLRNVLLSTFSLATDLLSSEQRNFELQESRHLFKISSQTNQSQQLTCDLVTLAPQREAQSLPFSLTIKCPHGIYTPASPYQFSLVIGVAKKPLKGLFGHARFSLIYQLINNSSLQSFKLKKKSHEN